MMIRFLEKIISLIKHEKYHFEKNIRISDLIEICFKRFFQVLRGIRIRLFIHGKGLIFCGKNVKLLHKRNIHAGNNLILGDYVYIDALSSKGVHMGNNVTISRNVEMICSGVIRNLGVGITLGNNVAIGSGSILEGQGGITIGNDTIMGPNVVLISENHKFDRMDIPVRMQGEERKGIKVGQGCWLGSNVIILDGVTIGNGCVIGAGAVVTRDIASGGLAVGNPARVIRNLNEQK